MVRWLAGALVALIVGAPAVAQEVLPAHAIPKDAAVVFASFRAGEKDPWGFPADAIYVANWKGKVTRITYSKFAHNHFKVSPDRRYVLANRYSRGDSNKDGKYFPMNDWKALWIIDTVTGAERVVAPEIDGGYGGVTWGPDSKTIYFGSPTAEGISDIRRVNIETGKVEVLTSGLNRLLGFKADKKGTTDVDISKDGTWLVFLYSSPELAERDGGRKPHIVAMKTDGSEAKIISDGGPKMGKRGVWSYGDFDPAISPDNSQVVYARMTDTAWPNPELSTWDLWVVNRDGTGAHNISGQDEISAEVIPSWGDDGMIAFTRAWVGDGRRVPFVLDMKTGERIRIDDEGRHAQMIPGAPKRSR